MPVPYPPTPPPCTPEDLDINAVPRALTEILNRVIAFYELYGLALPTRRVWGVGAIPNDCDELVVTMLDISPEGLEENCDSGMRLSVRVSIARCVPVAGNKSGDKPPTPRQIAIAGTQIAQDSWALAKCARFLDLWGMGNTSWNLTVDDPQGGLQSVSLDLNIVI